jgi:putative oxidoreductase
LAGPLEKLQIKPGIENMFSAKDKVPARDALLLIARILMTLLFIQFGAEKLANFSATATSFGSLGLPVPKLAACVAVVVELGFGIAIALGVLTRPLALLLAVYTVVTGLIAHHYWSMSGAAQMEAEINFYKNVAIAGGFLLLYLTGAGEYSVDAGAQPVRKVA